MIREIERIFKQAEQLGFEITDDASEKGGFSLVDRFGDGVEGFEGVALEEIAAFLNHLKAENAGPTTDEELPFCIDQDIVKRLAARKIETYKRERGVNIRWVDVNMQ